MADIDTSAWWLERLGRELDGRQARMARLDDYYRGAHPLLYASSKYRQAFGNLFSGFADNFCSLVVDAVEERLDVEGFRMGADRDIAADADAWHIWQRNGLDSWSGVAHTEALVKSASYALVWADEDESDEVEITIQDALEMAVGLDRTHHDVIAAMKRWREDDDAVFATLYLPDRIEKWEQTPASRSWANQYGYAVDGWSPRRVPGEPWPLPNPLGEVPVVPLVNRPRLDGSGQSEIASVIPLQNALNKLFLDMLVAAEYAAFPQRYATGIELLDDPDTGKPINPFRSEAGSLWTTEGPTVFGQFAVADLAPYVKAIETTIQHVASITRTPPHYLLGQAGAFPSGESLKATETGLVAKARRRQRSFGESWEQVIRLAFRVLGDARGEIEDSETIWRDPETRTESEHVDAVVKMGSDPIGIPSEALWEDLGKTPQQIARYKQMKADEAEAENPTPNPMDEETTLMRDEAGNVTLLQRARGRTATMPTPEGE